MIVVKNGIKWYTSFCFQTNKLGNTRLLIDTGADCSTVTSKFLSNVLPAHTEYVMKENVDSYIEDVTGRKTKTVTINLRNVLIGDTKIPNFYCRVFESENYLGVLGMDFISNCNGLFNKGNLSISSIDINSYEQFAARVYKNPIEVNTMLSYTPEQIAWCRKYGPDFLKDLSDDEVWNEMKDHCQV